MSDKLAGDCPTCGVPLYESELEDVEDDGALWLNGGLYVRISDEQSKRLVAAVARDGTTADEVVRRALGPYLDTCDKFGGCGRLPGE